MEIWRIIPDYNCNYKVSNLGRVYSNISNKYLSFNSVRGYKTVSLNGKNRYVHQLVAICFLNHKPNGHKSIVDHIDGNHLNNRLDNLQIITQRQNLSKDKKNKTSKYTGVCWNKRAKKWFSQIRDGKKVIYLGVFRSELEAANAYKKAKKALALK
jgi:hypothetical protein